MCEPVPAPSAELLLSLLGEQHPDGGFEDQQIEAALQCYDEVRAAAGGLAADLRHSDLARAGASRQYLPVDCTPVQPARAPALSH
jgi:hypothetical protein